jgi:hypothetical protein
MPPGLPLSHVPAPRRSEGKHGKGETRQREKRRIWT